MTIFTCDESFEAMMTCIYDAWSSRLGHQNIRLQLEPILQTELFCAYISIKADEEKAKKVVRSIQKKISFEAYQQVYQAAMSFVPDRLDAIYRFLLVGFSKGAAVTQMFANPAVQRILELSRKTNRETCYFREFTRFSSINNQLYIAHIEPQCNVLAICAQHFADRMPAEYWTIIDDNRHIAAVHPKNQPFYLTSLSEEELLRLRESEETQDIYTALWQEFFHSISIDARKNYKCQRNHMPLWYRKHMTEFA